MYSNFTYLENLVLIIIYSAMLLIAIRALIISNKNNKNEKNN